MKKVLITGITGQDGAYLAELLLSKGFEVQGMDVTPLRDLGWTYSFDPVAGLRSVIETTSDFTKVKA